MVQIDRSFIPTEETARRAATAGVLAWHRTPRAQVNHLLWIGLVLVAVVLRPPLLASVVVVVGPIVEVLFQVYRARKAARTNFPLGQEVYLGFGDDSMVYRSPLFSGELSYSCIDRVIPVAGHVVIDAPSHHTFWPLPAELVPDEALAAMRRT